MIRVVDVSVRFGDVLALPPTSFDLAEGERVSLVGRNGSGKTTLVRVLAGLLPPSAGRVEGRPAPGRIVLVHQRPHLFRGTALDNVLLGARLGGGGETAARALLDRLGVSAVAGRDVRALSGGERRRVAVARALARRPDVLLLDEPLAELDPTARARVLETLGDHRGTLLVTSPNGRVPSTDRELDLAG